MLSVAVVGCGFVSKAHLEALKKLESEGKVRLEATCDILEERAKEAKAKYGFQWHTADYRDIVSSEDIEIAFVFLPVGLHRTVSDDLMAAQKHVLVEKPMALNERECDEMVKAMERYGVILYVGHVKRKNMAYQLAKTYVEKHIEPVYLIKSCERWYGAEHFLSNRWRANPEMGGGGIWMDIGCHYVDIFRYIAGEIKNIYLTCNMFPLNLMHHVELYEKGWQEKVERAYKSMDDYGRRVQESRLEGNALSSIELDCGAIGEIDVGWCTRTPEAYYERTEIFGEGGAIIIESPPFFVPSPPKMKVYLQKRGSKWIELADLPPVTDAFYHQAREFVGCVQKGECCSALDGKRAIEVVRAGYLSYEKGYPVELKSV